MKREIKVWLNGLIDTIVFITYFPIIKKYYDTCIKEIFKEDNTGEKKI
jgi:hypothetical protein